MVPYILINKLMFNFFSANYSRKSILILFCLFFLTLPNLVWAVETTLGQADNFGELVTLIWNWGAKIILSFSVLTLIIAGFFYVSAGGEIEKINQAKQVGLGSIIAASIVLFSGVLKTIIQKPLDNFKPGETELSDLTQVVLNISNLLLTFVASFAVLVLILNGVQYMLAKGEEEKIEKAKRNSKYAVWGLIIAVSAYYIIGYVVDFWINS